MSELADGLLVWMVTAALVATALALLAASLGRWVRRPAVLHAMWAVVLLRLVTPPLLPLPVVPLALDEAVAVPEPKANGAVAVPLEAVAADLIAPSPMDDRPTQPARPAAIAPATLLALSYAGTAWVLGVALLRARRFRGLLETAAPAPQELQERAGRIALQLGLPSSRLPRMALVDAPVPPMLWPDGRRLLLVLPRPLFERLSAEGVDLLVAHELAHVARRDHWWRLVELAATAIFWWLPATWWARRALRRAEERACDDLVLAVRPASSRAYAEALVETVALLARTPTAPLPAAATGAAPIRDLEQRFEEILMKRPRSVLTRPVRLALLAAAAVALAVFPSVAHQEESDAAPVVVPAVVVPSASADAVPLPAAVAPTLQPTEATRPALAAPQKSADAAPEDERTRIDRERIELETRLRELEVERLELEGRRVEADAAVELRRMEREVQELQRRDQEAQARRLSSHMEYRRAQLELQKRHIRARAEYMARVNALQLQAMELRLELQRRDGDEASSHRLREQLRGIDRELDTTSVDLRRIEMEMAEATRSLESERDAEERAWLETLEGRERERAEKEWRQRDEARQREREAREKEQARLRAEQEAARRDAGAARSREEAAYRDAEREREARAYRDADARARELDEKQRARRAQLEEALAKKTQELADLQVAGVVGPPVDRVKRQIEELNAALGELRP